MFTLQDHSLILNVIILFIRAWYSGQFYSNINRLLETIVYQTTRVRRVFLQILLVHIKALTDKVKKNSHTNESR